MTNYDDLQKRLQRGSSQIHEANNLIAEAYGVIGALVAENTRLSEHARLARVSAEITVHTAIGRAANDYMKASLERDGLKSLLKKFVDGEYDQDENQAERHMYLTDAQAMIAAIDGELEEHSVVPDSAIAGMNSEIQVLRKALTTIREESHDIGACECAADALVDARKETSHG